MGYKYKGRVRLRCKVLEGKETSFIFKVLNRVRLSDVSRGVIQRKEVGKGPAASWVLFKATLCNYFTASESLWWVNADFQLPYRYWTVLLW